MKYIVLVQFMMVPSFCHWKITHIQVMYHHWKQQTKTNNKQVYYIKARKRWNNEKTICITCILQHWLLRNMLLKIKTDRERAHTVNKEENFTTGDCCSCTLPERSRTHRTPSPTQWSKRKTVQSGAPLWAKLQHVQKCLFQISDSWSPPLHPHSPSPAQQFP